MKRIDLHAHTTHSDGTCTPTELVALASDVGLDALAVTDHDTTTALAEAREAGKRAGVEILGGCEITAGHTSGVVHVLAYDFDAEDAALRALLAQVQDGRDARNDAMFEKLAGLGVPLEEDEVRRFAVGRIVARPHFARAMVERGYVDSPREAFNHYLRDGGPAYVRAEVPAAATVIETTARAGAITVLAHPRSLRLGTRDAYVDTLTAFREAGLVGVEVDHPSHDADRRRMFGDVARLLDLVASGGSDFHGSVKPHIALGTGDGTIDVRYETWERLCAARDRRAKPA
jgi:predicted metal-dependent phosphoesterase TrpH